jgi:hypothetical protein
MNCSSAIFLASSRYVFAWRRPLRTSVQVITLALRPVSTNDHQAASFVSVVLKRGQPARKGGSRAGSMNMCVPKGCSAVSRRWCWRPVQKRLDKNPHAMQLG